MVGKKSEIKAVIFDVCGVLVGGKQHSSKVIAHSGVQEHMAKKFGVGVDTWIDLIETPYNKSMEGKMEGRKAVGIIAKRLGISSKELTEIWLEGYKKKSKRDERLYKLAFMLRKKGYIIGILSDQWHLSKKSFTPRENIKGFSPVIISCEVGCRKPNLGIYKLLMKELKKKDKKIKPEEVVFIDNRKWNLIPARKLGINVILFKDNEQLFRDLKRLGVGV